ncbi:MAG TPA: cation:proton antiporter [Kofleriaceae bacterium]|jgi:CPA2 family monovalent cation:H+ antiporter-2|nr:cation:proton antiporter [Kofleriaceae bacterium]
MAGAHELLTAITIVLCVAAVTTVVFQRLRQPVVLGYLLAGLIVGPHLPIPLIADRAIIQTLSELGVILLMFALGLEFSLRKLVAVGPTAGLTAIIQSSIMVWLGFIVGRAFGWTPRESIFAGAIIAISSTTIIAKAFDEQGVKGKLRELVVGVLIVEDLIGILLMAVLTAVASGQGMSAGTVVRSSAQLVAFLVGLVAVGMLVVPRAIRAILRLNRPETTLVASVGICFAVALLAQAFGYSVALGAFLAGSLVAESGQEKQIEHLILPVRDLFAAIFFVSVGMLIDPALIAAHWVAVTVFTVLVIAGKFVGVSLGAFLTGNGTRSSVAAGMSLAQIGEFSFIIAALGLSLGATRDFLYPIAVAVSALTTLTTPWLIRAADPVAAFIDRKLPHPLQTFASLYGTWLERLRAAPGRKTAAARTRRWVKLLVIDVAILSALVIGTAMSLDAVAETASTTLGISEHLARGLELLGAAVIAVPFLIGIVRITHRLGLVLARIALPAAAKGRVDLDAAPRRVLVVTLQLAVIALVGLPMLAVIQPFVPGWAVGLSFGLLVVGLGFVLWRRATNLHGHVKAGAQMIVEALVTQAGKRPASPNEDALAQIHHLMPGLGELVPVRLDDRSAAVGKTLAQLNLRGITGASVLAIARGDQGAIVPGAGEVLHAGDVLALAGTRDALAAATELLERPASDAIPPAPPRPEP